MDDRYITDEYAAHADKAQELERVRGFECFTPAPLPSTVVRGTPNECSVTAMKTAIRYRLTAARGYALFERGAGFGPPVWIGHWWTVTSEGVVVDASWADPGLAYIGERIAVNRDSHTLSAHTLDGDLIGDLGVFVYPPPAVEQELERKQAEWLRAGRGAR